MFYRRLRKKDLGSDRDLLISAFLFTVYTSFHELLGH